MFRQGVYSASKARIFEDNKVQIDSPGWYDRQGLCDVKEMVDTPSLRKWLNLVAKDCFE